MTHEEFRRAIEGPVALYLTGEISHGRFRELMAEEFPEAGFNLHTLHPLLFNLTLHPPPRTEENELGPYWDHVASAADYCKRKGMPELAAHVLLTPCDHDVRGYCAECHATEGTR